MEVKHKRKVLYSGKTLVILPENTFNLSREWWIVFFYFFAFHAQESHTYSAKLEIKLECTNFVSLIMSHLNAQVCFFVSLIDFFFQTLCISFETKCIFVIIFLFQQKTLRLLQAHCQAKARWGWADPYTWKMKDRGRRWNRAGYECP